jgi:hypothetical protein
LLIFISDMPGERDIIKNLKYIVTVEDAEKARSVLEELHEAIASSRDALITQGFTMKEILTVSNTIQQLENMRAEAVEKGTWNLVKHQELLREILRLISQHPDLMREIDRETQAVSRSLDNINRQLVEGQNSLQTWSRIWNEMARALGLITVPASLVDLGSRLIQFAESMNRVIYGMRGIMAVPGEEAIGTREAARLEFSLRGLSYRVGESEETLKRWIGSLKSSEIFFETEWGRQFQRLTIEAASGSAEAHRQLDEQIEYLSRTLESFKMTTGYGEEALFNFSKYMSDLTRMDFPQFVGAYYELAKAAREANVEFRQFESFFRDIFTSLRMYGITLGSAIDLTKEFGEMLNLGVISTRDFVDTMNIAKSSFDPNKTGTMLWYLANFGQSPEVKDIATRALQAGSEGIAAWQHLMGVQPQMIKEYWDKASEEWKRQTIEAARILGYQGEATGQAIAEFRAKIGTELPRAMLEVPGQIGSALGSSLAAQEIYRQLGISTEEVALRMGTAAEGISKLTTTGDAFNLTIEEQTRFAQEEAEMRERGNVMMKEQETIMRKFLANINEAAESLGIFSHVMINVLEAAGIGAVGIGGITALERAGGFGLGGGGGGGLTQTITHGVTQGVAQGLTQGLMRAGISGMQGIFGGLGGMGGLLGVAAPVGLLAGLGLAVGYSAWAGAEERRRETERAATTINNRFIIQGPDADQVATIAAKKILEAQENAGKTTQVDQLTEIRL